MAAALPAWRAPDLPIRVGISSCLLGEEVRYDGGHQKDAYITGVLARHFTWVPVCPETEVGTCRSVPVPSPSSLLPLKPQHFTAPAALDRDYDAVPEAYEAVIDAVRQSTPTTLAAPGLTASDIAPSNSAVPTPKATSAASR